MRVWDSKLFDICDDAYQNGGDFKISYVISGDEANPDQQFADVQEIERVQDYPQQPLAEESASAVDQIDGDGPTDDQWDTHTSQVELAPLPTEALSGGKTEPEKPKAAPAKAQPRDEEPPPLFAW